MKNVFLTAISIVLFSCTSKTKKEELQEPDVWHKNSTIYEVNIRQFTPEGTFNAFIPHIDRIHKMGIDILWFMPIHPIGEVNRKGGLGSYYSVKDYKGINAEHGTATDFKAVVDKAHSLGMKVLIDWVANHSAFDNNWVENKEWYTLDSLGNLQPPLGTDWWDVADLNYENTEMRLAMIEAMQYWVRDFYNPQELEWKLVRSKVYDFRDELGIKWLKPPEVSPEALERFNRDRRISNIHG